MGRNSSAAKSQAAAAAATAATEEQAQQQQQDEQQPSCTQHSEAAHKSEQPEEDASAPATSGKGPTSNGVRRAGEAGEAQSGATPSRKSGGGGSSNEDGGIEVGVKQDPSNMVGAAGPGISRDAPAAEPAGQDDGPSPAATEVEEAVEEPAGERRNSGGRGRTRERERERDRDKDRERDVDMAAAEDAAAAEAAALGSKQTRHLRHQQQHYHQEFAFRPTTRPRTRGSQRPRSGGLGGGTGARERDQETDRGRNRNRDRDQERAVTEPGSEPITPHAPTSGLDSLACAAAWELGDEDAPHLDMACPTTTARSSQRESEGGGPPGEYVYDDDGGEPDEYEEGDDEEGDEDSPYDRGEGRHGPGHAGGPRTSGSGRRPCPRRGGAPRPRDPSAESGAEEAGLVYAATSGRPELDLCAPDDFEADLVGFLTARGERQLAAHVREKRITCNSLPLDIYGLYREVVKRGGYIANERYDDKGSRWTGTINFAGDIFPRLKNWTANNRATSVGSQLLNNYRKFLLAYERAYCRWDLPSTELAAQQRAAAATAGSNVQASAAAIVAAAIAASIKRGQPWEVTEQPPSSTAVTAAAAAAAPSHRRSTGGTTTGTKRSNQTIAVSEPGSSWRRDGGDPDPMEEEDMDTIAPQQTGLMPRSQSWAGERTAREPTETGAAGLMSGSKRRRQTSASADGTPGSALPVLPALPPQLNSPPTMRRVEHMQQQWASAQLQLWSSGQAAPAPGTVLLVQDPGQPALQWAVVVAELGDLPLEVAEGGRLPSNPTPHAPRVPMRLLDVSPAGRLEDATPVMLLGSHAMGWVSRIACRQPTSDGLQAAMSSVWGRIATCPPNSTDAEQACVRGLKLAMELLGNSGGGFGLGAGLGVSTGAMGLPGGGSCGGLAGPQVPRTLMQAAAVCHTARRLLELEGVLCPTCLTASSSTYWVSWRTNVSAADSPSSLTSLILTLTHQILPSFLISPLDMLWLELLPLLGLHSALTAASSSSGGTDKPMMVCGAAGEPTCLGVDMAVMLLRNNIDWQSMQRAWTVYCGQLPPATTPMGTFPGMMGGMSAGAAWGLGPMATTPTPMPTPTALAGPINVVDRSRSGLGNETTTGSRRPLPPVGPTAPPPSAPVGQGFSSRNSTQGGGAGLPPRPPPPVRVSSSGAPGTGPSTGGAMSPNSHTQQHLSLSPLRLVPSAGGPIQGTASMPGYTAMQPAPLDVKPDGSGPAGQMGVMHMGAPAPNNRPSTDMGAANSSPTLPGNGGPELQGQQLQQPQPQQQQQQQQPGPMMMVATGGGGSTVMAGGGLPSSTVSPLTSPSMQGNTVMFSAPPQGVLGPIQAVPLDLSAPPNSNAGSQFQPMGPSPTGPGVFGMMMPGPLMGMGGGLQLGVAPPGGMMGPGGPGHMNLMPGAGHPRPQMSVPMGGLSSPTGPGMLTSPPPMSAQQPLVVRDPSMGGMGPGQPGAPSGEGGMMLPQWGPMEGMVMQSGQAPLQMQVVPPPMLAVPPPGAYGMMPLAMPPQQPQQQQQQQQPQQQLLQQPSQGQQQQQQQHGQQQNQQQQQQQPGMMQGQGMQQTQGQQQQQQQGQGQMQQPQQQNQGPGQGNQQVLQLGP